MLYGRYSHCYSKEIGQARDMADGFVELQISPCHDTHCRYIAIRCGDRKNSQDSLDGVIWKPILFRGVMMIVSLSRSPQSSKKLTNLARLRANLGSISMRPKLVSAWRLHVTRHILSFIEFSRILVGFVEALVTPYILSLYFRRYSTA
jgi:hypothetical protein